MSIFGKLALRSLRLNRARTLVTVIGVALSAALMTAVTTFGCSLLDYTIRGAQTITGDWHISFSSADPDFARRQAQDARVAHATSYQNLGYAVLDGSRNEDKPYLFLAGFSEDAFDTLPVVLLSGRLPENSSEVLLPKHVASNGGVDIAPGDQLTLSLGTRLADGEPLSQHDAFRPGGETLSAVEQRTVTVVGICRRPAFEETAAPGYTLITVADESAAPGSVTAFVSLKKPRDVLAYREDAAQDGALGAALNDRVLRFMGLSQDRVFTALLFSVGGTVIAIVMLGSVFLIHNAFAISLSERMRQIGVLASVGATARQLRSSVLFEGLCIGLLGIPPGILLGVGTIALVIRAVARSFADVLYSGVPLVLTLSFPALAAAALLSMVTILISAYIPARKAAAMPVMACIRQTAEIRVDARDVRVPAFASRALGLEGMLALKSFGRNRRRSLSITLSLALSAVLFICTSSFVTDLRQASERAVVFTTYDIGIKTEALSDADMIALHGELKTADGVTQSMYLAEIPYFCSVPAGSLSDAFWQSPDAPARHESVDLSLSVMFLEEETYAALLSDAGLNTEDYTGPNAKLIAVGKMLLEETGRTREADEFDDLFAQTAVGLRITPKTDGDAQTDIPDDAARAVSLTLVSVVAPDTLPCSDAYEAKPYILTVYAPYSLKPRFEIPNTHVSCKGLTFQSGSPSATVSRIEAVLAAKGLTATCTVYDMTRLLSESRNMILIADVFSAVFIAVIALIAVANVFNTISTNVRLRRRELAMLRSVGMDERGFARMMRIECLLYDLRALALALPVSLILSLIIWRLFDSDAGNIDFILPWQSAGIASLGVALAVGFTMAYAVRAIRRENIIDALRDEMT